MRFRSRDRSAGYGLNIFLLILLLQVSGVATGHDKPLVINTTARAPHYLEDGSGFINVLVAEIFRRLDIEHQLIWLPAERSLVFTNNGTVDGVVPRARAVEASYTNLVRVSVEVFEFEFMAYTRDSDITVNDWSSLIPYNVGIINGWKIVEQNLDGSDNLVKVNNYKQLLTLLDKGRIDVAILDRVMGGWVAQELGFEVAAVEPPLNIEPTYFYLHEKHRDLAPAIARTLSEMKQEGVYDDIYRKTLAGFASPR